MPVNANDNIRYVSTNGDDTTHAGLDWNDSFLTIKKALSDGGSNVTVFVAPGVYPLVSTLVVDSNQRVYGASGSRGPSGATHQPGASILQWVPAGQPVSTTLSTVGGINNHQTTLKVTSNTGFPTANPTAHSFFYAEIEREILLVTDNTTTTWTVQRFSNEAGNAAAHAFGVIVRHVPVAVQLGLPDAGGMTSWSNGHFENFLIFAAHESGTGTEITGGIAMDVLSPQNGAVVRNVTLGNASTGTDGHFPHKGLWVHVLVPTDPEPEITLFDSVYVQADSSPSTTSSGSSRTRSSMLQAKPIRGRVTNSLLTTLSTRTERRWVAVI